MPLRQETKDFLKYLRENPGVRSQIAAPPDKSLVYAGRFIRAMWRDLEAMRSADPATHDFVLLPDLLKKLPPPGGTVIGTPNMYEHLVRVLDPLTPWEHNGFIAWRAVSGIYASQAKGKVRFYIGSGVNRQKVFAVTEVFVLARNADVTDPASQEMIGYLLDCVRRGQVDINVGLT
jgi:hypothetical protein